MALTWAKELLGDAYTEQLEQKLETQIETEYTPKAEWEAAKAKATALEEQLNAANEAIGKFEGLDADQVKAQIADYKQRAEAAEKDRDEKLPSAAFDSKLENVLRDAKAKNPKLVRGALDIEKLRKSKNQDADIAAAIEAVRKSDGYLFGTVEAEPAPAGGTGVSPLPGGAKYTADELSMRKAAGLPVE